MIDTGDSSDSDQLLLHREDRMDTGATQQYPGRQLVRKRGSSFVLGTRGSPVADDEIHASVRRADRFDNCDQTVKKQRCDLC